MAEDHPRLPSLDDALGEFYVVEWSYTQNQLHIQTVAEMHDLNAKQFSRNQPLDYVALGLFMTHEEASDFAQRAQLLINARREAKG
jgi:hypothetical protein